MFAQTDWYGLGAFVASVCTGIAVVLGALTTTVISLLKWRAEAVDRQGLRIALAENTTLTQEKGEQAARAATAALTAAQTAAAGVKDVAAKVEEVHRATNGLTEKLVEAVKSEAHAAGIREEKEREKP